MPLLRFISLMLQFMCLKKKKEKYAVQLCIYWECFVSDIRLSTVIS